MPMVKFLRLFYLSWFDYPGIVQNTHYHDIKRASGVPVTDEEA